MRVRVKETVRVTFIFKVRVTVPSNGPSVLFQAPLPIAVVILSGNAIRLPILLWLLLLLFEPLSHVTSPFCSLLPRAAACLEPPALSFVLGPKCHEVR